MKSKLYRTGKWRGENAIFGPGGPYLYENEEQMHKAYADMNGLIINEVGNFELEAGVNRLGRRIGNSIAAKFGHQAAVGKLQIMNAAKKLRNDWFRYAGGRNLPHTIRNIANWVKQVYQINILSGRDNQPAEDMTAGEDGPATNTVNGNEAKAAADAIAKEMIKPSPDKNTVLNQVHKLLSLAHSAVGPDRVKVLNYLKQLRASKQVEEKVPEVKKAYTQKYLDDLRWNTEESKVYDFATLLVEHNIQDKNVINELYHQLFEFNDALPSKDELDRPLNRFQFDQLFEKIAAIVIDSGKFNSNGNEKTDGEPETKYSLFGDDDTKHVADRQIRGSTNASFDYKKFVDMCTNAGVTYKMFDKFKREFSKQRIVRGEHMITNVSVAFVKSLNITDKAAEPIDMDEFNKLLGSAGLNKTLLRRFKKQFVGQPIREMENINKRIIAIAMLNLKV